MPYLELRICSRDATALPNSPAAVRKLPDDQRVVLSAEPERVAEARLDVRLPGLVWHIVEIQIRIRIGEVDRRGKHLATALSAAGAKGRFTLFQESAAHWKIWG